MSALIVIRGHVIRGGGDRALAVEQAERLDHLADELTRDLTHWQSHLDDEAVEEVVLRIERHRRDAREYRAAVTAFDNAGAGLTPGELANYVTRSA